MRDFIRDISFGWSAYKWATMQKKTGKSPVYSAYLAQKSERTVYAKGNRRGAAHADDMLYLKGAFDEEPGKYPQEKKVSDIMQQYWVNFAKTGGNPNGEGLPSWPVFEEGKATVMQFNNGASLIEVPNKERIMLIDRFMKYIINLQSSN
jgi:para-nitrobenzyl esterase